MDENKYLPRTRLITADKSKQTKQ